MAESIWLWVGFNVGVLIILALDLGVFHRKAHAVSLREAAGWSAVWVTLAMAFNAGIWYFAGRQPALEFLTGYLVEKSLAVDNIFVIALIFSYFAVPAMYQHRILFWGILGALVMRGAFIAAGAYVLHQWHWVIYVFGGILLVTGVKMALRKDESIDPEHNPVVRLARRWLPLTQRYDGQKFWTVENGRRVATPLFLVLLLVEFTDLVFAIDSIPAIFAITSDPFIVYTSNIFAILGLRSLFFLLAGALWGLRFLKPALGLVLGFVGAKMCLPLVHTAADKLDLGVALSWLPHHVPTAVSLCVVGGLLAGSVCLSLAFPSKKPERHSGES